MSREPSLNGTVLIVDDEQETADLLAEILVRRGFKASAVGSGQACLERVQIDPPDVVVTDLMMPGISGLELCEVLRARLPNLLSIVVTGRSSVDTAISAIRAGAYDYIAKPVSIDALELSIMRAFDRLALRRELERLRELVVRDSENAIIGESPAMREMLELVHRVAKGDATVLITGESGTGKELIARMVHDLSPRSQHPFVAINCAAMPASLLESELFGHVRGAFTDANRARTGLLLQAGEGTVFLDEIGEMPLEMQVKLLRVLQERRVRPVGSDEELPLHARVLAATNHDLEAAIAAKRFREDLFYRINVVPLSVPPLRERGSDILLIAQHFLRRTAFRSGKPVRGITPGAARVLLAYQWPGNVRQLQNCIERAVALCGLDQITVDDLPDGIRESNVRRGMVIENSELVTLAELERRYVYEVLCSVRGNKSQAARLLGIDRRSLYRRLVRSRSTASAGPEVCLPGDE